MDKPRVLISLCLLGAQCRYDGQCKPPLAELALLQARFDLIPICPEQLGGLATPRPPAERRGSRVVTASGLDAVSYTHLDPDLRIVSVGQIAGGGVFLWSPAKPLLAGPGSADRRACPANDPGKADAAIGPRDRAVGYHRQLRDHRFQ